MKLLSLKIKNFRTIEDIELSFPRYYSVICGKNDSGKTNIVRAIRGLLTEDESFPYLDIEETKFAITKDYPKWLQVSPEEKSILIELEVEISKMGDTGLYEFIRAYLAITNEDPIIKLKLSATYKSDPERNQITVEIGENIYDGFKAQEVLRKLQSSKVVLFHKSSGMIPRILFNESQNTLLKSVTGEYRNKFEALRKYVQKELNNIAKRQQKEISEFLNYLEEKHTVALSMPSFEFDFLPFDITLGDNKINVPLDDWGTGTQNRTLIIIQLLMASQIINSNPSPTKIIPFIVIEEPENFLHPSAQAAFGRSLKELSEKLEVQVLVTSHSPYMLSLNNPNSNILLERKIIRKQARATIRVNTSESNWMQPFSLALGLQDKEFMPWKNALFNGKRAVLLVEGDTDKEYFELLKDDIHGSNKLNFDGDIIPYDGRDNLKNQTILKFLKNTYPLIFITYDLDAESVVEPCLRSLGYIRTANYIPIGRPLAGKQNIEGLISDEILGPVYSTYADVVSILVSGTSNEKKHAKGLLKRLILEEFKVQSASNISLFTCFYPIVKVINKAFNH
jgi:predicted ATP-dependent endonuclease of OLD family